MRLFCGAQCPKKVTLLAVPTPFSAQNSSISFVFLMFKSYLFMQTIGLTLKCSSNFKALPISWIPDNVGSTTITPRSTPPTEAMTGQPILGDPSFRMRLKLCFSAICLAFCLTRVTSFPEFSSSVLAS